jgi:hypothetical protein
MKRFRFLSVFSIMQHFWRFAKKKKKKKLANVHLLASTFRSSCLLVLPSVCMKQLQHCWMNFHTLFGDFYVIYSVHRNTLPVTNPTPAQHNMNNINRSYYSDMFRPSYAIIRECSPIPCVHKVPTGLQVNAVLETNWADTCTLLWLVVKLSKFLTDLSTPLFARTTSSRYSSICHVLRSMSAFIIRLFRSSIPVTANWQTMLLT